MDSASGREVAETEVSRLLKAAGGSYVRAYESLVRQAESEVSRPSRSTVADRQKGWRDALAKMDRHRLADLRKRMAGYVSLIKGHELAFDEGPRPLEKQEQVQLMEEFLAFREIDEFLKVRREWIRSAVFSHITETLAAVTGDDGSPVYPNPDMENGRIEVPEVGKAFVREGCGPRDPDLNEDLLRAQLGEETWASVCEVHVEQRFSPEKLMKLAERDPSVLEKVKDCFVDAGWKSPRFVVKDI